MRVLVSNDDGYRADGIVCLVEHLRNCSIVNEVIVIAPDRNRSGASNSLTLEYPLRAKQAENGFIYVDGTPTDCVHLAITGLLSAEQQPDIVVSGINEGPNLGDDVIYSGTVAAAMEGRFLGLPAIAVSASGYPPQHYATSARVVIDLLNRLNNQTLHLPPNSILNVNVPDLSYSELMGMVVTRLGSRHRAESMIAAIDPRNRPIYWIGSAGDAQDAGPGTDFHAVQHGYASITPLHIDLTQHTALDTLRTWLTDSQAEATK